jgi:hypothetical protein
LAWRLIGGLIAAQAPQRTLAELDRAAFVAQYIRRYGGLDLPSDDQCQLFANVEVADRLELAIAAGGIYIAFCWWIDQDWRKRFADS